MAFRRLQTACLILYASAASLLLDLGHLSDHVRVVAVLVAGAAGVSIDIWKGGLFFKLSSARSDQTSHIGPTGGVNIGTVEKGATVSIVQTPVVSTIQTAFQPSPESGQPNSATLGKPPPVSTDVESEKAKTDPVDGLAP